MYVVMVHVLLLIHVPVFLAQKTQPVRMGLVFLTILVLVSSVQKALSALVDNV
jgi:hypothetical protein